MFRNHLTIFSKLFSFVMSYTNIMPIDPPKIERKKKQTNIFSWLRDSEDYFDKRTVVRSGDCVESFLTGCKKWKGTNIISSKEAIKTQNKPVSHICNLIFFPRSSTVLILKSIPVKRIRLDQLAEW